MAYDFIGFRATKPVVRLIDEVKFTYEVFFALYDPAGKKRNMRYSKTINSEPASKRQKQAIAVAKELWEALQRGWNPMVDKYPNFYKEQEQAATLLSFEAALKHALELKLPNLSKESAPDYRGTVRFFLKAAAQISLTYKNIDQVERRDIRLLLTTAKQQNGWTSKARNKYFELLRSLLTVLEGEELIKNNPAFRIKKEAVDEGVGFRSATQEEKEKIAECLMTKAPAFFDYIMFIYQSGIRRKELLLITIDDINLERREIKIRPEVAKSNKQRIIPVPGDLYEILLSREVYKLPKEWFLFSSSNFKPGPKKYHANTPTNWWRALIIEGLEIDCKMYGMKHTGGDDKIRAGIDLDVLKTLYGHKSKRMTEVYARAVKEKYADTLRRDSPAFAKVVEIKRKAK